MKKILKYAIISLLTVLISAFIIDESRYESAERTFFAMDTVISIKLEAKEAERKLDELAELINKLDSELSRTDEKSLIYRLNHSYRAWAELSSDAAELLREAEELSNFTEGTFDISIAPVMELWGFGGDAYRLPEDEEIREALKNVGMEHIRLNGSIVSLDPGSKLDFGGIAKGFALEKAGDFFKKEHVRRALVYMGGDILAYGSRSGAEPWRIAVEDPVVTNGTAEGAVLLKLKNSYFMTSGNYQRYFVEDGVRYHHIMDPSEGRPAQSGLSSVSIAADTEACSGSMCDALSTALFVMGEERAIKFWRENYSLFDFVIISDNNEILISEGLKDSFIPLKPDEYTNRIIYR